MNTNEWTKELSDRLKTLTDRPSTKWPNVVEPNPDARTKLTVTFSFNEPDSIDLKNGTRYMGFMHVMVRAPLGEGPDESGTIADSISALFEPPLNLGLVKVEKAASVFAGVEEEDYFAVPVNIPFVALYT